GRAALGRPGRGRPAAEQRPAARGRVPAPGPAPRAERGAGARCAGRDGLRLRPDLRVPGRRRQARPRARRGADRRRRLPGCGPGQGPGRRRRRHPPRAPVSTPAPGPLVTLETATKAYGPRPLLDGVSLGVAAGDRIGVVGRNGAGKTTLLEALAGRAELDSGRATRARGLRLGYLPQVANLAGEVRGLGFGPLPQTAWGAHR